MIVVEFVPGGSLLDLLIRSCYYNDDNLNEIKSRLEYYQMIKFLYEIACGMDFLARIKVFVVFFNVLTKDVKTKTAILR